MGGNAGRRVSSAVGAHFHAKGVPYTQPTFSSTPGVELPSDNSDFDQGIPEMVLRSTPGVELLGGKDCWEVISNPQKLFP